MRTLAVSSLFVLALAGCESRREPVENLALACQLTKCICAKSGTPFFQRAETAPIEWGKTGEATCPEGFELRRDTETD